MTGPGARWLRGLHAAEDALLSVLLLGLLTLAVVQIVMRVGFDSGLVWAEPASRLLVMWLALLGALAATREGRHIAIDALPRALGARARRVCWILAQLAAAGAAGTLCWLSVSLIMLELEFPSRLFGVLPSWTGMLVLPLGFGLMTLRFLVACFAQPPYGRRPEGPGG
ncbi:MAG TPA: TRAP transporter small permease subunit [Xanthomonadaceae bacterium]|nr:TRAP transporter small permease subunit [Xanthomonadaceae bacterium]